MNTCAKCGKEFSYPPAMSRDDGRPVCRVCSAEEALSVVDMSEDEKASVLDEIAAHEDMRNIPV